ncbi:hypothetical protein DICVIV_07553 [Dictyocaulus viviparus]|uniref:non-specific serine/threonine protein kinase n=1 Tax=Dictyocaulus viviparus TaxID=29172 RepID=A0A0D8XPC9_DICVI|nr:hypothetical protein DICVIV_07553 [Dictyocaulus viviparus]
MLWIRKIFETRSLRLILQVKLWCLFVVSFYIELDICFCTMHDCTYIETRLITEDNKFQIKGHNRVVFMIDDNAAAAARFPVGKRFGNWTILRKIDEGGFGQVYRVENVVTKKIAALKAEPTEIEGGSALKLEMAVIRAITADGEKPHVPLVFHAAKRRRFCYMIMTLLGENLKELKMHCPKEFMSAQTWSRIGIQCLYSVKLVHDYGFVHRDIKPNNFVMGYREDYDRARLVHILDFGLSRSYAIQAMHCPKEFMSAQTWSRIGIQCLYSVKLVHDYGFVHRDIKPNNFVMGYREDYDRARLVHILDFGLSRSYAIQAKGEKWIARRARSTAEFRGTLRYCSPNVHEKKEQLSKGRRDDLWSLYYVLIELHCGLPWQTLRDKQKVELVKMHISDKDLVLNFPVELHAIIPYLRTLDYYQRPDYSMFYNGWVAFMKRVGAKATDPYDWEEPETVKHKRRMFYNGLVAVMKRVGAKATDPYDWEEPETVKHIQKQLKGPYAWENSAEFFKADPIQVNSPPPPKQKMRRGTYNFINLMPLDVNTKRDLSDPTTASTDADKGSVPSEQTMIENRAKLSLIRGVREKNLLGQKGILQQNLPTNFPTLLDNQCPNKRKDEEEIKLQVKNDRIRNGIYNAKSKFKDENVVRKHGSIEGKEMIKAEKLNMKEVKLKENNEKVLNIRGETKLKASTKDKSTSKKP